MGRKSQDAEKPDIRKEDRHKAKKEEERKADGCQFHISVRELVEFVMNSGDIDNRRTAGAKKEAMQEGSRLHRKIQKRMGSSYQAEVPMKHTVNEEWFQIIVEGRADGVITKPDGSVIDEIKCMYLDVNRLTDPFPVHLAQAMCYGYFWCLEKELPSIGLQITYCQIETEEIKRFCQERSFKELEEWFQNLIHEYMKWAEYIYRHSLRRQESIKGLEFPFPYRQGQKELAVNVYRAIARERNLYIQAPTGTGKTLSVIFPALKAMGEGYGEKLFYLTAKTITRRVAEEALDILRKKDLFVSSVTITAKEKLCFLEQPECNPEACPYAKGHYDRVNEAVFAVICGELAITRQTVITYAKKYQVCPFEFCLDISNWVDVLICDYNYVFDPNVCLKRYFAEGKKGEYLFLIDEAHNLVSRARDIYSAALVKEHILLAKRLVKERSPKLAKLLEVCNKGMLERKRECENYKTLSDVNYLAVQIMGMFSELERFMEENQELEDRDILLDFYFNVRDFIEVFQQMDDGYEIYCQMLRDGTFMVRLFCINPSGRLRNYLAMGKSTIFFSATLLPIMYYKELLSGDPNDYAIYAQSPFLQERRLLLVARDVSSRYKSRTKQEYQKIASYIREIVKGREGNYMVFCPSYQYLGELEEIIKTERGANGFRLLIQESRMDEAEREAFLGEFQRKRVQDAAKDLIEEKVENREQSSLVALCVMGGIFGEGIDLKEERLIGVIVIGTGLPMVCPEQELLKRYFDNHGKRGFPYAYQYPGMNKVMQAAGRVIRTMKDEGVIALLDQRFLNPDYLALFPREWSNYQETRLSEVSRQVTEFWKGRSQQQVRNAPAANP